MGIRATKFHFNFCLCLIFASLYILDFLATFNLDATSLKYYNGSYVIKKKHKGNSLLYCLACGILEAKSVVVV